MQAAERTAAARLERMARFAEPMFEEGSGHLLTGNGWEMDLRVWKGRLDELDRAPKAAGQRLPYKVSVSDKLGAIVDKAVYSRSTEWDKLEEKYGLGGKYGTVTMDAAMCEQCMVHEGQTWEGVRFSVVQKAGMPRVGRRGELVREPFAGRAEGPEVAVNPVLMVRTLCQWKGKRDAVGFAVTRGRGRKSSQAMPLTLDHVIEMLELTPRQQLEVADWKHELLMAVRIQIAWCGGCAGVTGASCAGGGRADGVFRRSGRRADAARGRQQEEKVRYTHMAGAAAGCAHMPGIAVGGAGDGGQWDSGGVAGASGAWVPRRW